MTENIKYISIAFFGIFLAGCDSSDTAKKSDLTICSDSAYSQNKTKEAVDGKLASTSDCMKEKGWSYNDKDQAQFSNYTWTYKRLFK